MKGMVLNESKPPYPSHEFAPILQNLICKDAAFGRLKIISLGHKVNKGV